MSELCDADHEGDEEILRQWLANKTPASVAQWLRSPSAMVLLAALVRRPVGVCMLDQSGEVLPRYAAPEVIGKGVEYRLLQAMLQAANEWSLERVFQESTATARKFYLRNGYEPAGKPVRAEGTWGYPMYRQVVSNDSLNPTT